MISLARFFGVDWIEFRTATVVPVARSSDEQGVALILVFGDDGVVRWQVEKETPK